MATLAELIAQMQTASQEGNSDQMLTIAAEMKKCKAELAKAEAERLAKEATELAEARKAAVEKLERLIRVSDKQNQSIQALMAEVKAIGFHYIYKAEANETVMGFDYQTPAKAATTHKGGSGQSGKSKAEYGLSLSEIVEKFGTEAERAAIEAETNNSKQWQLKVKVKKAAIEAGLLKPVK